ncbi:MAG: cytochrome c biogenesis protein DipZ [Candidatus Berkiella sp.]
MQLSFVEISLAFLEGLALIASPCILPILPLVLSAAVDVGKLRPYGIILGFILSFTFFALGSAALIKVTGIDLNLIKQFSLVILFLLGIMLISNRLSEWFSRITSGLANKSLALTSSSQKGFFSGLLIGSLIGLVWTPCAGPILAAALVQIIRQESHLGSALMVLAFSLGAAIPMLLITLTGRAVLTSWGGLVKYTSIVRKVLGVLILVSVIYIATGMDLGRFIPQKDSGITKVESQTLIHPLSFTYQAPEFEGIEAWLNSPPLTMKQLKGKVVLIDFWTYSCINCIRTLPYIIAWDKKYRDKGLVIIGVHSPEFEFEKDISNVEGAITRFGITYPVAIDNQLSTWQAFSNRYWPAHYLIDKNGNIVYTHFGEGAYEITEHNIQALLGVDKEPTNAERDARYLYDQSPETYLGYERQEHFASGSIVKDASRSYDFPATLALHHWALQGDWKLENERIVSQGANTALRYHFKAKQVFLVMGNRTSKPISITVLLEGQPQKEIEIKEHQLYELVNLPKAQAGILEIRISAPGLEAYAFTFGNE